MVAYSFKRRFVEPIRVDLIPLLHQSELTI
jgi:hypothetical protein